MIYIKSFKNYEEFKEIFGIVEHGNGVKSRKNKILLACLKDRKLLHWWMEFRKIALRNNVNESVLSEIDYLSATGMTDFEKFAKAVLYDLHLALERWRGKLYAGHRIVFSDTGWRMLSQTMELDNLCGLCEDGDTKAIRYRNVEQNKVFKMKAGKFVTRCIEELPFAEIIPEQLKRWIGEEFAREWQSYAEVNIPNVKYELHVDDNFAAIYDGSKCVGDFHSCMTDKEYHSFYENAVDASAAYLTNTDGNIVARCVIYNEVKDMFSNTYALAERQYATGQDTKLMQILVDMLIKKGRIDGYKRVGAGCYDTDDFILNNGKKLDRTLFIDCELEDGDVVSFQDSFQYFNYEEQVAYNSSAYNHDVELSTTSGIIELGKYSEWNDRRISNAIRDEYFDDYIIDGQQSRIWYNGRFMDICDERAREHSELRWSDKDECFYHEDDCVYAVELGDYIDRDDACEDIDGNWQLEVDCKWSDYHEAYILEERCHYSSLISDYVDEDVADVCPTCGDWIPNDYEDAFESYITGDRYCCEECILKAEAVYRKAHALRVVS